MICAFTVFEGELMISTIASPRAKPAPLIFVMIHSAIAIHASRES
jgi:hypothetical protein